jgi:ubiquitin carboxyl-terminal hydrolase 14
MQVEAEAGPAESMVIEEDDSCYATYQLTGVLTHKGTDADGGHYVAWIRKDDGTWYLFDDHKVSTPTCLGCTVRWCCFA